MMIHCDEARCEDTADIFNIFERKRRLRELSVRYLCVYHLVNGIGDRFFGKLTQAA